MLKRWEPPAGPSGFEGLVAQALATLTGYTFRLARSGAQFGRDAATPNAPFSIAMEAKRYNDSVPLQELVGKAGLATFELAEGVDVWALAATVEVSEPTQRKLVEILDTGGITLVALDWTEAGVPPIAVLLAATRADILPWAEARLSPPDYLAFRDGLEDVATDAAFERHRDTLLANLSPALVGIDAFRERNAEWCEERFGSHRLAQRAFSQFLSPLESPEFTVSRLSIENGIAGAVENARSDPEGESLVAVLGGEGSGKSWAVAKWWHGSAPRPILLLSAGRMADLLSSNDEPLDMLARLAAHQQDRRDEVTVARWRRRLERWSSGDAPASRFAIVIDGLNETSGKAWSTILRSLLPAARQLGGVVIATCREAYWSREIGARLAFITCHSVHVGDYDDAEFADLLSKHNVDPTELPERLNRFMRNPRICALALTLRSRLSNVDDLSVDRLLVEYWRARLLERGDLLGHDDIDFRNLLMEHAREYRKQPGTNFNRDEWRARSGAARRDDGRNLANDLSDIEEGRFFDAECGTYRFREDTLHFALGLLLANEIRVAVRSTPQRADEAIAAAIDPVRGFDAVVDIMTSAIAVASLDDGYPDSGISALMSGWLSLQNVTDDKFEALVPYVAARPEPFLDAFEQRDLNNDDERFLQLLLLASRRDSVSEAVDARLNRWLGCWSRAVDGWGDRDERQRRLEAHNTKIDEQLGQLTGSELDYVRQNCPELASTAGLAGAAAMFLSGIAQARFARGIVAFAFARTITGPHQSPFDDIAWVLRLNRIDFEELTAAVRAEIAPFTTETASTTAREAAARALRLLGSLEAQQEAETLSPPLPPEVRDRPINPLDPASEAPPGIAVAAGRVGGIDPAAIWTHMSTTSVDHDLERSHELLVRFEPESIMAFLDRIAATVSSRTAMPLRQLGWRLPWLSPIMGADTVKAVERRIREVIAHPELIPDGDVDFVTGMMVEGAMPRLGAEAQLDLLQSLPTEAPFYMRYSTLAKPLSAEAAERRLRDVLTGHPRILERTLLFLSANAGAVTDTLRHMLVSCLGADDLEVRAAAADFARGSGDVGLDEAIIRLESPDDNDGSWRAAVIRSALASAICRLGRPELVDRIPAEHIDWVAARMPAARERLADMVELTVERFLQPIAADEPTDAVVLLEVSDDLADTRINLVDRGEKVKDPIAALNAQLADMTGESFSRRQKLLREQFERFVDSLTSERALMVARRPYQVGLEEVARDQPKRYAAWLRSILQVTDESRMRNLQNLGFALAQNYAGVDGDLAARAFAHLWKVEPHVTVQIGAAKHAIRDLALFTAAPSPEIDALREQVFEEALDDARIERLVVAAEAAGLKDWLDGFVASRSSSVLPSDQALALTVASFRPENLSSADLLGRDWLTGFLGNAARDGRARYRGANYAAHWFNLAAETNDPREQWRLIELGIAAADLRQLIWWDRRLQVALREIGGDVPQRLRKSIEKASKENEKTLYGMRKPTGLLARMVGA